MIHEFILGLTAYLKAPRGIVTYRLWPQVLISGLISLTLYSLLIFVFWNKSDLVGAWLIDFYPFEWGKSAIEKAVNWITFLSAFIIFSLVYKYIILVVLSPIMSVVSEKIERHHHPDISFKQNVVGFINSIIRGLRLSLRNIIKELLYTLLLMIGGWIIPGAAIITTPLIFLIQAYYVGAANIDYFLERHTGVSGSVAFTKQHKGLAMGNGTVFLLILLIPILGALFAPILGTIASSREVDRIVHTPGR